MTTRADLLALADRVEREEPGFAMNKEILRVLGFTWRGMAYWSADDKNMWTKPIDFTTSLDAAASLVPITALEVTVRNYQTGTYVRITTQAGGPVYSEMLSRGGPCEPQARTAAALRARAIELKGVTNG